jgi:ABC-type multidrug transport system permease subunit
MATSSIALRVLKNFIRTPLLPVMFILLPLFMAYAMGLATGGNDVFLREEHPIRVAYVSNNETDYGSSFHDFIQSDNVKRFFKVENINKDNLESILKDKKYPLAIVVTDLDKVELYSQNPDGVELYMAKMMINRFNRARAVVLVISKQFGYEGLSLVYPLISNPSGFLVNQLERDKGLTMGHYYSATMLVMFLIFSGLLGGTQLLTERVEERTFQRILTTPNSKISILLGYGLGNMSVGILQGLAIILGSKYFMGIQWGSPIYIGLLLVIMVFLANSIAMLISSIFSSSQTMVGVFNMMVIIMTLFSGTLTGGLEIIPGISRFTINYWAHQGFMAVMANGSIGNISTSILIITSIGISLLMLAAKMYGREEING